MSVTICPRCNQRIIYDKNSGDIEHECNSGNASLDNEDVIKVGDWEDYTGTGTVQNALSQGVENELFGTRAAIEGEREQEKTDRGNNASTHRVRQHVEFIELEGGVC